MVAAQLKYLLVSVILGKQITFLLPAVSLKSHKTQNISAMSLSPPLSNILKGGKWLTLPYDLLVINSYKTLPLPSSGMAQQYSHTNPLDCVKKQEYLRFLFHLEYHNLYDHQQVHRHPLLFVALLKQQNEDAHVVLQPVFVLRF